VLPLPAKCWTTLFLYIFIFLLQYIDSYNHSLITVAEALLHVFIAAGSVGGTSLGCRAEIRTRACLTASQRTTNWAALHPEIKCWTNILNILLSLWSSNNPVEFSPAHEKKNSIKMSRNSSWHVICNCAYQCTGGTCSCTKSDFNHRIGRTRLLVCESCWCVEPSWAQFSLRRMAYKEHKLSKLLWRSVVQSCTVRRKTHGGRMEH
jgi:hypothetical protein